MHFLFKSNRKDDPVEGVDWIVLTANALGIAVVTAATLHASAPNSQIASAPAPSAAVEVASLD